MQKKLSITKPEEQSAKICKKNKGPITNDRKTNYQLPEVQSAKINKTNYQGPITNYQKYRVLRFAKKIIKDRNALSQQPAGTAERH